MMDFYDPTPQAVPTFPVSSSGPNCGYNVLAKRQSDLTFGATTSHAIVPQGSSRVQVKGTTGGRSKPKPLRGVQKKEKAPAQKDPAEIHAGGVRFRSIQFARSIRDILDGSIHDKISKTEGSTVALVEVVAVLASRMSYPNFCWEFVLRDPTVFDSARKNVATPGSVDQPMPGLSRLHCKMYDAGDTIDRDALEQAEVVRIIGIVSRIKEPCEDQTLCRYQLQCVAIRSASMDELRMTVQGHHRGLDQQN
ncbi:hypothetical protein BGX31_005809 [Mortierella sp. GBA43]|nr:hypothetical protein BGX31_005809 [Mortierella sp. GBA43]